MSITLLKYPRRIEPFRYARNGFVPEAPMARRLINGQNHIMAYRRKTVLTANETPPPAGSTTANYHTYYRAGYGATHLGYVVCMMPDTTSTGTDPYVYIRNNEVGGGTTSAEIHAGLFSGTPTDGPDNVMEFRGTIAITANTDNYVDVTSNDYARIQSICLYEIASDIVDNSVNYYVGFAPTTEFPIWDAIRQKHAEGLSNMWAKNGGHLMGWYGPGHASYPTYASTTWTNVIDTTTAVAASSQGYYLGDGDQTLEYWARHRDSSGGCSISVKLAVHCSVTNSATGEVRLQDSGGTVISITGMGTASAWYTSTANISSLDALAKCDLQCRTSNAANTVTLHAVVLYAFLT